MTASPELLDLLVRAGQLGDEHHWLNHQHTPEGSVFADLVATVLCSLRREALTATADAECVTCHGVGYGLDPVGAPYECRCVDPRLWASWQEDTAVAARIELGYRTYDPKEAF